jgi:trans-L-3-hydroxyproline dehydratase
VITFFYSTFHLGFHFASNSGIFRKKYQLMIYDTSFTNSYPFIETLDMHTGGEPLRIVLSGIPEAPGNSITEKIRYFREHYDHLRTRILWEPRGHADMYGAVLTDPVRSGSDLGVFFLHNEGYSSMCGHAIIALTTLFGQSDPIQGTGTRTFRMDVPSGTVVAYARFEDGRLRSVAFDNVPSWLEMTDQVLEIEGHEKIPFDLAFGGAYYLYINAAAVGIPIVTEHADELIRLGRKIKHAFNEQYRVDHPTNPDLSFLYGVIFYEASPRAGLESRNACVFADGELDRSATGTGVSGKAALLHAKGLLKEGQTIRIESIIGSEMSVTVQRSVPFGPFPAIVPRVGGKAYVTGRHRFFFDPQDPFRDGFFIR